MIECVPNVSEGRDPTIIARIGDVITGTGCRLIDTHSDVDHHRTVYTMIGETENIANGAVALAESATALINLNTHCGVHPRIGAVDVVPFVPLGATPMSECVAVAQRVGRILGERLDLPVLLYGEAATSEQRVALPWIRRGGRQALASKLQDAPPDFGPRHPHPTAGVVAIGARSFLVAFNIVLNSNDVVSARTIASTIREANGGLRGVRALGLALESRKLVQVSMNLTQMPQDAADLTTPTLPQVFRTVESEAKRLGIAVLESELVGLVPRAALADGTAASLRMKHDPRKRILETRIADSS